MPQLIRSENDLPTLRISRGRSSGSRSEVVFEAVRGSGDAWEAARCPAADLGIPDSSAPSASIPEWVPLPPGIMDQLEWAAVQGSVMPPYRPTTPSGSSCRVRADIYTCCRGSACWSRWAGR